MVTDGPLLVLSAHHLSGFSLVLLSCSKHQQDLVIVVTRGQVIVLLRGVRTKLGPVVRTIETLPSC